MNKIDEIKYYQTRFETSRRQLLSLVAFTAINLVLVMIQADFYFIFTALIPVYALYIGKELTLEFGVAFYNIFGYGIAVFLLLLYGVSWFFTKRYRTFILIAFVLFLLDCLVMVYFILAYGFELSDAPNLLYHGWIIYTLTLSVIDWYKLRKVAPEDEELALTALVPPVAEVTTPLDSVEAEPSFEVRADVNKGRTVIFAEYDGLQISIKRSPKRTELIIDGQVYDEFYGLLEGNYTLKAQVNNHLIEGKCNAIIGMMYIYVDGALIKKKLRLY